MASRNYRGPAVSSGLRGAALLVLSALVVMGVVSVSALATGVGASWRASVSSSGAEGNGESLDAVVSADGRYVAFVSDATSLVAGDTNRVRDVFVRDTQTGATTRASVDSSGGQGDDYAGRVGWGSAICSRPALSADGRYVAFCSAFSDLVPGDTNGWLDVFVHDTKTGATTLVSLGSWGEPGVASSGSPAISADGRYVAFASAAPNIVSGDTGGATDVFVRDCQVGRTRRVSVDSSGTGANSYSCDDGDGPAISADGRYVAFFSAASNLVAGDTNARTDVFLRDMQEGTTRRVSVDSSGTEGDDHSGNWGVDVSADGRYVAFSSHASNLVPDDANGTRDVFVHDIQSGTTTRVSLDSSGVEGDSFSDNPSVSANGRYVAFSSWSRNLVTGHANSVPDVFVRDRQTGSTVIASVDSSATEGNSGSGYPGISADGSRITFYSVASNLVADDTNGFGDIFVHDNSAMAPADSTPPVSWFDPSAAYEGTAAVSISATDGPSGTGVAGILYRLDGATTQTASSILITAPGSHSLVYRARDFNNNLEATHEATFTVWTDTRLTLLGTTAVTYPKRATLTAQLLERGRAVASKSVVFERKSGSSWTRVGTSGADADGIARLSVAPKSTTTYRARFAGAVGYRPSVSAQRTVRVRAYVGTPVAPSRMSRRRNYTIYGYLKPRHTAGKYPVRIVLWKRTSWGHWIQYGDPLKARAANYKSYTKYSRSIRLPRTGVWQVRAYAPADSNHVESWSAGSDTVRVY